MRYEILEKAFSLQRTHGSKADADFAAWLVSYIAQESGKLPSFIDGAGNLVYEQGGTTLFAAHLDTAHWQSSYHNEYAMTNAKGNKVKSMKNAAFVKAVDDPLGADDAVGVLILVGLLLNGQAGSYAFTRGEEQGGIGAESLAANMPGWLAKHKRAVCFDRRDTHEIIITQGGKECASEVFGETLADAYNDLGMLYDTSTKGVYTDCREWIEFIPECVNIGAGYWNEHTDREYMDLNHVRKLYAASMLVNWEGLPTVRKAKVLSKIKKVAKANSYPFELELAEVGDVYEAIKEAKDGEPKNLIELLSDFGSVNSSSLKMNQIKLENLDEALAMPEWRAEEYLYELTA